MELRNIISMIYKKSGPTHVSDIDIISLLNVNHELAHVAKLLTSIEPIDN